MSDVEYRLVTAGEPKQVDDAPPGVVAAKDDVIHTTESLEDMVAFIRDDDRFSEPDFSADDADRFEEHGSYSWYEGGIDRTPYIVRRVEPEGDA